MQRKKKKEKRSFVFYFLIKKEKTGWITSRVEGEGSKKDLLKKKEKGKMICEPEGI